MSNRQVRSYHRRLPPFPARGGYWRYSRQPLNCLIFISPFLVGFEVCVAAMGTDLLARNQLRQFLYYFGATGAHLSAALVVLVLGLWQLASRRPWRTGVHVVGAMYLEAIVLAVPLLGLGILAQRLAGGGALIAAPPAPLWVQEVLAGIGAGVYEEFIFRLVGLNICMLLLFDVIELPRDLAYALAIAACSVPFALYHFPGAEPVIWPRFIFYALAGAYLAGVYVVRGFGLAAGTHIFYNMAVALLRANAQAVG